MKQILQNLRTGATEVTNVPSPTASPGHVLVRTSKTLISVGTERMLVEFGKANLLNKAREQPERVQQVLNKIRTDGLLPTIETVFAKLNQPLPLGYCNVGAVLETGRGVSGFSVGSRVVSNGKHAEVVAVPKNLCALVPEGVTDDEAAFTVLGAVALQGIRLINPTLGEAFVVTGLGLVGLLTVQLLKASGCRVLGLDFDPLRLELARKFGAETVDLAAGEDPVEAGARFSKGRGVDGVLLTASTKSSKPVHQGAQMCRKRGRIVLVGVTGLELSRADFFDKELSFQVSCSYGPGRHDPDYEQKGQDYPFGFVRWTEQRNLEAVLDMMASGRMDVSPLISHRFDIDAATNAYELVGGDEPSLGIVLSYPDSAGSEAKNIRSPSVRLRPAVKSAGAASLGFIGSGNYASSVLIPAFKATGARLRTVVSATGVSAVHAGKRFGFEESATEAEVVFADPEVKAVIIATRHDSHADLVCRALEAGKHVFVEKPLALTAKDLERITSAHANAGGDLLVMVGFNRRFAPHIKKAKALLGTTGPSSLVMTVNAGAIPSDHWVHDIDVGGGRIIGEACHFIDLLRFLAGAPITGFGAVSMESTDTDTVSINLKFANGTIGAIQYYSNGHKSVAKERLEIYSGGRILHLDNFRKLSGHGWPGFNSMGLWRQDKGQKNLAAAFVDAIKTGSEPPIAFDELVEVSSATIAIAEMADR
ncbi:MAG: Gfo/Idh/MocA family oxidoreductase [Alphaproteobacteria bacterium]|nr:Gfo/Idh/MocA family oxidoreductase [Alphaproteobacteria bacterium]